MYQPNEIEIDAVIQKLTPLTDPQGIVTKRLKAITPHLVTIFNEAKIPRRRCNVISIGCGETANELTALIAYLPGIQFNYLGIDIDEESIERSQVLYKNFSWAHFKKLDATKLLSSSTGISEHAGKYDLIILRHPYLTDDSPNERTTQGNTFKKIICDIVPRLANHSAILLTTHFTSSEASIATNYLKSTAENNNPCLSNPYFFRTPLERIEHPERDTQQGLHAYQVARNKRNLAKAKEELDKYLDNSYKYTDAYVFKTEILELRSIGEAGLKLCLDFYKKHHKVFLSIADLEHMENTGKNNITHIAAIKPEDIDTKRLFFTLKTQLGVDNTKRIMKLLFDTNTANIIIDQKYFEMLMVYHAEKSKDPENKYCAAEIILNTIRP